MFALRRIPEGGCILADEVGLGKTIEAGLIIAQMMAEGAARILIFVPKPLLGQWQDESLHAVRDLRPRGRCPPMGFDRRKPAVRTAVETYSADGRQGGVSQGPASRCGADGWGVQFRTCSRVVTRHPSESFGTTAPIARLPSFLPQAPPRAPAPGGPYRTDPLKESCNWLYTPSYRSPIPSRARAATVRWSLLLAVPFRQP